MIDFWIPRYLSYHKMSVTELLLRAESDPENFQAEDDVKAFEKWARENLESPASAIHTACHALIRGMYNSLGINTSAWFNPVAPKSKNAARDEGFPIFLWVKKL